MAQNHFLAGVGTALLFKGNDLVGVAKTLTESTFDFAITAEDIRGGLSPEPGGGCGALYPPAH